MKLSFDKEESNWNNSITPKEIFERQFNIGHFLLNHDHQIISQLLPIMFSKYEIIMKFVDQGYNNEKIYVTKTLAYRKNKFSKVQFTKGVRLIEGTPTEIGGSNGYPRVSFKEGYCILKFITDGLPCTDYLSGWKTELILLTKL